MRPDCFGKSNNPKDSRCKVCALFLPCAVATAQAPPSDLAEIGHIARSPSERPNRFKHRTCAWAACRAVNLKSGIFTEDELLPLYVGVCHSFGIDPGSAERNIRSVIEQLVRRGILKRTKKSHLSHVY